ncbi:hypothetical protein JKF63_04419 [Porcisia hertigi]|uniref:Guanine nucleotide-binding protein subunit beta-like protein n=1 Tax=Porcisia hertigi TaxID=2761500 RepID=A0A836HSG4_9TRYP|nr:hypothetical protein JKF63_04419 [Porcisia hertigi]
MSNNYLPFSTAPVTRGAGVSTVSHQHAHHQHQHHVASASSNGLIDGMLPPSLATRSPSVPSAAVIGRGVGGSMLPYPIPTPQSQQQQHAASVAMMNACGPTGTGGVGMPSSGPAVPAPRSAAALLAETTGAPPPPPAPSRAASNPAGMATVTGGGVSAGIAATAATAPLLGAPSVTTHTPPSAAVATATPEPTTALSATTLMSPTFKAFTTSASAVLSSMMDVDPMVSPVENVGGAAAAAIGVSSEPARLPAINPHSRIEIQLTLSSTQERADADDDGAFGFEEQSREDCTSDCLAQVLMALKSLDSYAYPQEDCLEREAKEWYGFILDCGSPHRAAVALKAKMSQLIDNDLSMMLEGLAGAIIYYNIWSVASLFGVSEKKTLCHLVLRIILKMLVAHRRAPHNAERYVSVLLKMLIVGWVSIKGILDTVELCLQNEELIHIGLRILIHGFHKLQSASELRTALDARPRLARRLAEVCTTDPALEIEVTLVTRWWRNTPPSICGSVPMENPQVNIPFSPVTCMEYFPIRDEVVTGDMRGVVTLWGPPMSSRQPSVKNALGLQHISVRQRGVVPLPMDCVPIAMAGQRLDGQYLAIAGMPLKSRKPYSKYSEQPPTRPGSTPAPAIATTAIDSVMDGAGAAGDATGLLTGAAAGTGNAGAIIVITCNENSLRWTKGEIVMRPPGIALTAITAFRNSIVAVGESAVSAAAAAATSISGGGSGSGILSGNASAPHRLSFVDVVNGVAMRQIPKAHDNYITALTVLEESSYVLLSGGRDAAVKMWDPRSREDTPVVNTALCKKALHNETTISSLHTAGYSIITTDVNGAMVVWDLRNMATPHKRHQFAYPIVDATLIQDNRAAIATSRGIVTVSLDTLEPEDLFYDKGACTRLLANDTGDLLFAAWGSELDVCGVSGR